MKRSTYQRPALTILALLAHGGCTSISIAPSCPNELQVDESAPLLANEINPGAIAKYLWEVLPPQIGQVTDPTMPSTTFKATGEGEAVIRLTASDGLYQVISECQTRVAGTAEPPPDASGNANDNVDDGKDGNDNGGGRPPRPGRRVRVAPP